MYIHGVWAFRIVVLESNRQASASASRRPRPITLEFRYRQLEPLFWTRYRVNSRNIFFSVFAQSFAETIMSFVVEKNGSGGRFGIWTRVFRIIWVSPRLQFGQRKQRVYSVVPIVLKGIVPCNKLSRICAHTFILHGPLLLHGGRVNFHDSKYNTHRRLLY